MKKPYKIIGQDLHESHITGVRLRIKNLFSGKVFFKSPLEVFQDSKLITKLRCEDILKIGYLVGEHQRFTKEDISLN